MTQPQRAPRLSGRAIFRFWAPLASTWLMMSVEGPFLAAIIARAADPTENLAAFGVAFAAAVIIESPVIMLLSASTALVVDRDSFLALRRFTYWLNAILTCLMVALLVPPISRFVFDTLLQLPGDVAAFTRAAFVFLLPWPAAIGYRRFYQGLLIRSGRTQWVAYGTMFRVAAMAVAAMAALFMSLRGASIGALALTAGVVAEAVLARINTRGVVAAMLRQPRLTGPGQQESSVPGRPASSDRGPQESFNSHTYRAHPPLTAGSILAFYVPLATMSALGMAVQPMITFFMGHSRHPLESLAVLPVVNGLTFVFRSIGLSYHEAAVALVDSAPGACGALRDFAARLSVLICAAMAAIAFSPLAVLWFEWLSGLTPQLAGFAVPATRILAPVPAMTVVLSFQRALLVKIRDTKPVTVSTLTEVATITVVLVAGIYWVDLVGATAAAVALLVGRIAGVAVLARPASRAAAGFTRSA